MNLAEGQFNTIHVTKKKMYANFQNYKLKKKSERRHSKFRYTVITIL